MNICQIGSFSFSSEEGQRELKAIGGISGYIFDLVHYLLKEKHKVIFVGKVYFYKQKENLEYIEVQKKPTSTNRFLLALFFKSFFIHLPKNTIIHAHRPDHFAAFAWFRRNRSVITLHGQQSRTVYIRKGVIVRLIFRLLEYIALRKVSVVIATDKITESYYLDIYPWLKNKIKVLPTGIDTKVFYPLDKNTCKVKTRFKEEDKIVMYIGRIEPPKRIEDIILSFQIVYQYIPQSKLVIVGDGVLLEAMKKMVEKLNLNQCVFFTGVIMRDELPLWINAADVTVLYSYNEGSPLSVKESLACGVPVIANRVGDVGEIIVDGKNGYLLEPENNSTFSELIKKALSSQTITSDNCIESIMKFSLDSINRSVEQIYGDL